MIQYDGTEYRGWQVQPSTATIQGLLEEAIEKVTAERVHVAGAGRTDAGVHAMAQVASFPSSTSLDVRTLKKALNALLPDEVRITCVEDAPAGFHARYDAVRKRYFYLIANMDTVPPFVGRYVWWIRAPLDVENMKKAASLLEGRHDFSSFRGAGCGSVSPVRDVHSIGVDRFEEMPLLFIGVRGNYIRIRMEADGFLRHMVRNITGTLVEVGRGKMRPEEMRRVLESRDRKTAGPTAPARGLFLEKVVYAL